MPQVLRSVPRARRARHPPGGAPQARGAVHEESVQRAQQAVRDGRGAEEQVPHVRDVVRQARPIATSTARGTSTCARAARRSCRSGRRITAGSSPGLTRTKIVGRMFGYETVMMGGKSDRLDAGVTCLVATWEAATWLLFSSGFSTSAPHSSWTSRNPWLGIV